MHGNRQPPHPRCDHVIPETRFRLKSCFDDEFLQKLFYTKQNSLFECIINSNVVIISETRADVYCKIQTCVRRVTGYDVIAGRAFFFFVIKVTIT